MDPQSFAAPTISIGPARTVGPSQPRNIIVRTGGPSQNITVPRNPNPIIAPAAPVNHPGFLDQVGSFLRRDVFNPIGNQVSRDVQPIKALGADTTGLVRAVAGAVTHNPTAEQNALNVAQERTNRYLAPGKSFITAQEAQNGGTQLIKPILRGVAENAPYVVGGAVTAPIKPVLGRMAVSGAVQGATNFGSTLAQEKLNNQPVNFKRAAESSLPAAAIGFVTPGAKPGAKAIKAYDAAQNEVGAVGKNVNEVPTPKFPNKNMAISNAEKSKPPAAPPKAPVEQPTLRAEPPGTKSTRFANVTVQNSDKVDELTKMLTLSRDSRYNPATVKEGQAAAKATYGGMNLDKATLQVSQKLNGTKLGQITRQDVFNAHEVADRLQRSKDPASLAQASDIYAKLAEHHTAAGQQVQAAAALARQTPQGMLYSATKALNEHGVQLDENGLKDLQSRIDKVTQAKGDDAKSIAYQELVDHVNSQIPRSKVSAGIGIWRAGLLSGPETAAKVAFSHLVTAPLELTSRPVTAAVDKLTGLITGRRTMTLSPSDVKNFVTGEAKGVKAMGTKFRTNVDVPGTGGFEKTIGQGTKQTAYERFFAEKIHGNLFKPNFSGGYRLELGNQARLAAADRGLTGTAREDFIHDFMMNPTKEAKDAATNYAEKFTNMNKTELGKFGSMVQKWDIAGLPIGKWLVPFSRIPTAIATKGIIDLTPLGIVKGVTKAVIQEIQHGSFDQRAFSETLGRASVGSAATTAVGFKLMENGRMTLQEPNDPKEKALWLAEGKQRNSIYVGGTVTKDSNGVFHYSGGRWATLNALGPAGIAIGLGGAFHNSLQTSGDPVNATLNAVASAAKLVSDQPYFKGISGASNAINNPKQYAQSYINSAENSLIPAGVQQTARGTDTTARVTPQGAKQVVEQGIPGLRENLPAQVDLFGNKVPSGNGGSVGKDIIGTVNPFYPSASRNETDAPTLEIQRLYTAQGSQGSPSISQPQKTQTINGQKVKLNNSQMQDYITYSGNIIHSGVANLLQNPDYQNLTDEQKTKQIDNIITAAHDAAKIQVLGNNPKTLSSDAKQAIFNPGSLGSQIHIPGLNLAAGLDQASAAELVKVGKMSTQDKQTYLSDPKNKYNYDVASFQNDVANGKYTSDPVSAFSKQLSLNKQAITSNYSNSVTTLYGMSKSNITSYLNTVPTPQANLLYSQLQALDKALYDAGITSSLKFASGLASSSGRGGGRSGSSSTFKAPTITSTELPKLAALNKSTLRISKPKSLKASKVKIGKSAKIKTPKFAATEKAPKFLKPTTASISKKGVKLTV